MRVGQCQNLSMPDLAYMISSTQRQVQNNSWAMNLCMELQRLHATPDRQHGCIPPFLQMEPPIHDGTAPDQGMRAITWTWQKAVSSLGMTIFCQPDPVVPIGNAASLDLFKLCNHTQCVSFALDEQKELKQNPPCIE